MKKQNGITLIALIITIIVLLILAGVTLATLTDEKGILLQTKIAKEKTEVAMIIEQVRTEVLGEKSKDIEGSITKTEFKEILDKYFNNVPEDYTLETVLTTQEKYGQHEIKVSEIYNGDFSKEEITVANYGDKVDYVSKEDNSLIWRIFYDDDNYVYIISSKSDGSNTVESCQLDKYIGEYTGAEDITDSFLKSLNSQWFKILENNPSTNQNAKAIAYLMDQDIWGKYKDIKGNASYAIGGPTLELFKNSYNKTSTANSREHQIEIMDCIITGYKENTSKGWLLTEYNRGIYNNGNNSEWWIASPSNNHINIGFRVDGRSGYVNDCSVSNSYGLRPIVIIPKSKFQYNIIPE